MQFQGSSVIAAENDAVKATTDDSTVANVEAAAEVGNDKPGESEEDSADGDEELEVEDEPENDKEEPSESEGKKRNQS